MSEVVSLKKAEDCINQEAIEMLEGVIERLRDGITVAIACVEVKKQYTVGTFWKDMDPGFYHQLNSGAAVLAHRLAGHD